MVNIHKKFVKKPAAFGVLIKRNCEKLWVNLLATKSQQPSTPRVSLTLLLFR